MTWAGAESGGIDWPAWVQAVSAVAIAVLTFILARATSRYVTETHGIASQNERLVEETNRMATLTTEALNLQAAPILAMNRDPKGTFRGASSGTYLHPEWINAGNGPAINIKFGAEWDTEHGNYGLTHLDHEFLPAGRTIEVEHHLDTEEADKYIKIHGAEAKAAKYIARYQDFFGNQFTVEHQIGLPLRIRIDRRDGTVIEFGSEDQG